MSRVLDATDRTLLARHLRRAADYHADAGTNVFLAGTTAAAIAATLGIPGVDDRYAHALTPRQARGYADQLLAVPQEVAA